MISSPGVVTQEAARWMPKERSPEVSLCSGLNDWMSLEMNSGRWPGAPDRVDASRVLGRVLAGARESALRQGASRESLKGLEFSGFNI